jgi:hypothetical protein
MHMHMHGPLYTTPSNKLFVVVAAAHFKLEPRSECIDLPFYGVIGFLQEAEPGSPHAGGVSSVA